MDHNSVIDRESFEVTLHAEDHPKVFICDKTIAPVVALLNKKGYTTIASCGGHYKIEFYEYLNEDIKYLEEYKNDDKIIIKKIKDNGFDYWQEVDQTHIYILFDKVHVFDNLPDCFELDDDEDSKIRTCMRCIINYYDENNKRKKFSEVMKEIENKCKLLEKWAEKLPDIKERE